MYNGVYNNEIDFVKRYEEEMPMMLVNVKLCHKCAFCKHWYDPTNSHIQPKSPRINLWQYDHRATSYCDVKKIDIKADLFCSRYECKL